METTKKNSLDIGTCIEIIVAILINLIIFSSNNILMAYTKHLALLAILFMSFDYFMRKKDFYIHLNCYKILYLLFLCVIVSSFFICSNWGPILNYSLIFILGICVIFFERRKLFYYYFLKIFKICFAIFIASMFMEAISPTLFHKIFSFASFGDATMRALTSGGAIAGLAFEKAYAAFLCNLGLGILFAEYISTHSKKVVFEIIFVVIALMMTGKRTLFLIPIALLLVYVLLFSKNNKLIKFSGVCLIIVSGIFLIYVFVPSASLIIDRFIDNGGDVLSGRENFWEYAVEMFRQHPLFGNGFLTFNDYIYNKGFRYYGEMWNYQAHNVYIQLLGETGIIGFSVFVSLILMLIKNVIKFAKKTKNFWDLVLVYWVILFSVYSLTGNTLYYPCQLIVLFVCIHFISNRKYIKDISSITRKKIKLRVF